jgi:hypothetical protein
MEKGHAPKPRHAQASDDFRQPPPARRPPLRSLARPRVVGKTAAKGTAVVGRTTVRTAARATGRGLVCVAILFHRCHAPSS